MKINGTSLSSFGIYLTSDTYLNSPAIDYTEYNVPARNGNIILDNKRLGNVVRKFSCYVKDSPETAITSLKKLIYANRGYVKLESDYDSLTYQMGYLAQDIEFSPFQKGSVLTVNFDLYFSCMPQKIFKSKSTATGTGVSGLGIMCVSKSDNTMQKLFAKIPPNFIPDDELFFAIPILVDSGVLTLTNISVTWSGGNTFMALQGIVTTKTLYSNTSITATTYTTDGPDFGITIFTPAKVTGTLTVVYTYSGTTTTKTYDFSQGTINRTHIDAIGVNLPEIDIYYSTSDFGVGTHKENILYAHTSSDIGSLEGSASVTLLNELYPASMSSVLSDYSTSGKYQVRVNLTTGETRLMKTGLPDLPMNDYFEIDGSISEGNKLAMVGYGLSSFSVTPEWWTL